MSQFAFDEAYKNGHRHFLLVGTHDEMDNLSEVEAALYRKFPDITVKILTRDLEHVLKYRMGPNDKGEYVYTYVPAGLRRH